MSGWVLFFTEQGQTAKRYAFYEAALVGLQVRYDGQGTAGQQPAIQVELHFSPATVEVDGQRVKAHSIIPWDTDPQTSFRALTKPTNPAPSAHLAALFAAAQQSPAAGSSLAAAGATVPTPPATAAEWAAARAQALDNALLPLQAIDSSSSPSSIASKEEDMEKLFENPDLLDLRNKISVGILPRRHSGIISVEEQAVIAYYTTAAGYRQFNLALRGQAPMTEFFRAQERILNGALEKLPKFQGSTIRGTGESETQRFANAKDGDVIEYENFVSSSTEEIIADDFMQRKKANTYCG